jgi:molecular chaperone HtpG
MKSRQVIEKRDEYFAYGSVLEAVSQGLYPDRKHILREFVQNAYDALADLRRQRPRIKLAPVEITASPPSLIIADKGIGMSEATMRRYRYLGFSAKEMELHAGFRGIGKFSGISVCDRLIVRSSKLGDPKSYQVEIDALGMFARLKDQKNPPLEVLLEDHSKIDETDEDPDRHYTFVELHSIHADAKELLDEGAIVPYLAKTAPVPFDPNYPYAEEISERLRQIDSRFLEVELRVNGKPVYKPFLPDGLRPDYQEVFIQDGSTELIAFAWFSQNQDKGQFQKSLDDKTKGRRHPYSGLHYRQSNFAIGDSTLARKTLWHTTPERAFYFFGEIHVIDSDVIPTSDRDDFEDTSARGRLYHRCREIATKLNFRAELESRRRRFSEVVAQGQETVSEIETELKSGRLESELKEDRSFLIQKLREDLSKRLNKSDRSKHKDDKVVGQARRVLKKAERLQRSLKPGGDGQVRFVDISKELKLDSKTKAVYETVIAVLREELRQEPQRFEALLRKIHKALREDVA